MKLVLFEIINCLMQKIGYNFGAPTSATEYFEKNIFSQYQEPEVRSD